MPIAVDAFCYGAIPGVTAYFLTHNHSDHYTNLSKSWRHGPIYCSETTANLVVLMLGVEPQWVVSRVLLHFRQPDRSMASRITWRSLSPTPAG